MKIKLIVSIFLASFIFFSCDDYTDLTPPVKDQTSGSANFSRYYALGNSLTAGYQSGTLFQSAQEYSYANLIAQRVGTTFEMPLISDPGLGGRLEIQNLDPFTLYTNSSSGAPINTNYPTPYNNLGVPGALTYDILFAKSSTTCASYVYANSPNPYFDIILRNSALNLGTPLEQALGQGPTFISLWIGNNDVLGYATSGGTSPSAPTPNSNFQQLYGGIIQGLSQYTSQTGAKAVLANIPSVSSIPFFTTVGPMLALNPSAHWWQIAMLQTASHLPATGLIYMSHSDGGTNLGFLPYKIGFADSTALLRGTTLLTLTGQTYAALIGKPTGQFYRDHNSPIPVGVDTTQPFGLHPQNPFPDAYVLDPDEIVVTNNSVSYFNSIIAGLAQSNGYALADVNGLLSAIRAADFAGGTNIDGINFRTTYVQGGLFSLDGVHPTSQGQAIIANEFIKAINSKFGASIPRIDVSSIPGSLVLHKIVQFKNGFFVVPKDAFDHLLY
jgi:lysophospholipase L1-like esterase